LYEGWFCNGHILTGRQVEGGRDRWWLVYEGGFDEDGYRDGQGEWEDSDGTHLKGEFKNNSWWNLEGKYDDGGNTYYGKLVEGKRHGLAKYVYRNGDEEVGMWQKNNKEGEHIYTYKDGRVEKIKYQKGKKLGSVKNK
jgi:hypothetical protein